jgi:aspartyl-tRNA(Asn)/glutamyl-tRNA(Gln) amidotransferase subunit A
VADVWVEVLISMDLIAVLLNLGIVMQGVPEYTSNLLPVDGLGNKPLAGIRFGIISETVGDGVDEDVLLAVRQAAAHLESLGASVREVWLVRGLYKLSCFEL